MRRIAALSLILLALLSSPSPASVSTNVPLGHWSYDAVEKLANYGLIDSSMLTTKPLTRLEMARHVGQAKDALGRMDDPPEVLTALVERLTREYKGELAQLGVLDGSYSGSHLKPVEDPYARYLYANKMPDLENRRGDLFPSGSSWRAGFASRGALFDEFAFYLHPEYAGSSNTGSFRLTPLNPAPGYIQNSPSFEGGNHINLVEGYGKMMVGPIELEGGRDSLWWGPGHHGSILMSNNARPLDMVKITNPQPIQLPWVFRALGPVKAEWFLAELEKDRDFPHANLTGLRVSIKPHPLVELAASRVSQFGGHGMPPLGFFDYFKPLLALGNRGESSGGNSDNQIAGFDASLLIPLPQNRLLRSIKLYTDAAGEDEANHFPSKWGDILGVQFNDILKTGRTDFRMEYADDIVPDAPDVFYTHTVYTSGYTYYGRVIGHYMGTASRDLLMQVSHYLTSDLIVNVAYDRTTHWLGDGAHAVNVYELDVTCFPSPSWQITGGYRFEQRSSSDGGGNHIVEVGLIRRF
jgi:hypothetical protein